jgi:rare lipoprotein A
VSRRAQAKLVAMLLASPLFAAPPVWASGGGSGGASPTGASPEAPSSATSAAPTASGSGGTVLGPGPAALDGPLAATATGNGITVTSNVSALLGRALAFTGTTPATDAGATIAVQRLDAQDAWVTAATGTVDSDGAFSVPWRTNFAGRVTVRTVLAQTASASQTGQTSAPTLEITVYRPGLATFYGKGFFGRKTACGTTLRRATLGVASRTLRCGTPVQIYYGGRTIVVPVIDRGPYANDATWDLTQATAEALGIIGTETVGAMPV